MKIQLAHTYQDIISIENLLEAWKEFVKGKRNKKDVQEFQLNLMDNILELYTELSSKIYKHGGYKAFNISDPKPRNIHKAIVRDRLLHHAIYRILCPFFDRTERRMFKRIADNPNEAVIQSYLGLLGWGNGGKLKEDISKLLKLKV